MQKPSATILFLEKKHKNHNEILQTISKNYFIREFKLQERNSPICDEKHNIDREIPMIKILIIYLSSETKNNACVCYFIDLAIKNNIKIIGIWIENSENSDLSLCMENFGDSITTYPANLIDIISSNIPTWIDANGNHVEKRKIKKHTCG